MNNRIKLISTIYFVALFALVGCGSGGSETAAPQAAPTPPAPATPAPAPTDDEQPTENAGLNAVFIGHSFFVPIATGIPAHAERLGLTEHVQFEEFSGGGSGAPMALWNDDEHRTNIQAALDNGDVELFAMTYEPSYPTTDGYILWIDYALAQNPDTKILLGLPWIDFPAEYETADDYAQTFSLFHDQQWVALVETLRAIYPDVDIVSMPYGAAATTLRSLLEAEQLPGITDLGGSNPATSIFRDEKGHGHQSGILIALAELVWLNTIYGVDLTTYDFEPDFEADIKSIANDIVLRYNSNTLCCVAP